MQYDEIYNRAVKVLNESGLSERWLDLGCETGSQNRLNREYMDRFVFETRLVDATEANLGTSFFDVDVSTPVIATAMSRGRVLENVQHRSVPWFERPPYLAHMAAALHSCGSIFGTGAVTAEEMSLVSQSGAFYHVVKPLPNDDEIFSQLADAERFGAVAVGMDITPVFGHKAWDEDPKNDTGVAPKTAAQLQSYVAATKLPFIVKGVVSVHDAQAAEQAGARGVVISNHGGECIDYMRPILHALPEIRQRCPALTIIVDSGFRRGTDVLKALCLGADLVAIGTPLVIGYLAAGRLGVVAIHEAITNELRRTMSACGFSGIEAIDASVLHDLRG